MDVSKNSGTPKWMVFVMENPIKMDDLGVPLFLETPIYLGGCQKSWFTVGFHFLKGPLLTCTIHPLVFQCLGRAPK